MYEREERTGFGDEVKITESEPIFRLGQIEGRGRGAGRHCMTFALSLVDCLEINNVEFGEIEGLHGRQRRRQWQTGHANYRSLHLVQACG
jgi:hypothetical protein